MSEIERLLRELADLDRKFEALVDYAESEALDGSQIGSRPSLAGPAASPPNETKAARAAKP